MPKRSMKQDDPLEDFTRRDITLDGVTKVVYVAGAGPAVIVMTEMPGISPHVARFSRWVRDAGFTVYMPSLFGRDGAVEILNSVVQRSHIPEVLDVVTSHDPDAFITVEEPKVLRGGMVATREWRLAEPFTRWMKGRASG